MTPCFAWRRSISRSSPSGLLADSGWFYMENWGVWASERRPSLVFDCELKQGDKVRIYLEVKCPPRSSEISLVVNAGAELASFKLYEWNRFISFEGLVGENGRVTISLLARGRFGDVDHRSIYTGLTSMAYCDGSDPLARIDLLEKVTLYSQIEHLRPDCLHHHSVSSGCCRVRVGRYPMAVSTWICTASWRQCSWSNSTTPAVRVEALAHDEQPRGAGLDAQRLRLLLHQRAGLHVDDVAVHHHPVVRPQDRRSASRPAKSPGGPAPAAGVTTMRSTSTGRPSIRRRRRIT